MSDVAAKLGVCHHQVRKLIKAGVLATGQIMPDAPHQIRAADLDTEQVTGKTLCPSSPLRRLAPDASRKGYPECSAPILNARRG